MSKVVLLNTETNGAKVINIEMTLENCYDMLKCNLIDVARRKIAGHTYLFTVDDEGLLIDKPVVSAVYRGGSPAFVGNLIVAKDSDNDDEDYGNLSNDDIVRIFSHLTYLLRKDGSTQLVLELDALD